MFLQTSIARNAYVTGSVHRQSVRIPSMIKNAGESIAHGASGHAACISLTRNDTIDVEDCRLAAQLADRGAVTSRVAVDEGNSVVYPENERQRAPCTSVASVASVGEY